MIQTIPLPLPMNRTVRGPLTRSEDGRLVVAYDYEHDSGRLSWTELVFEDVLDFEIRSNACFEADDVTDGGAIRWMVDTDRLHRIVGLWESTVGWQKWQQQNGGADRFRHFKLYLDDAGCIDVIAATVSVQPLTGEP